MHTFVLFCDGSNLWSFTPVGTSYENISPTYIGPIDAYNTLQNPYLSILTNDNKNSSLHQPIHHSC